MKKKKAVEPIYLAAGAALYECQYFEFSMANYLLCLSRLGAPELEIQEVQDILNNKKKMTAGRLIRKLEKHVRMTGQIPSILAEALEARNQIIHHQLIQNVYKFSSIKGRAEVIQEIHSLTSRVNRANLSLAPFIERVSAELDGSRYQVLLAEFERDFE